MGASQISNRTSNHKLGNELQAGLQLMPQSTGGIPEVLAVDLGDPESDMVLHFYVACL
jgi:hypothetical protein